MYQVRARSKIADSVQGTGKTVATVRQLINEGGKDPRVIAAARKIVAPVAEMHPEHEVAEVFGHVRRGIRYVQDPYHAETLTDASTLVREMEEKGRAHGDCDDHVIALGSLLEAIGYPTEPVVESYRPDGAPSHIALRVRAGARTLHLDPTVKDRPMGVHAGTPRRSWSEKEISMGIRGAHLGAPVVLAGGGTAEELTGKNEESAFGEVVAGIKDLGNWAFTTPYAQNWIAGQEIENAKQLAKLSSKFGVDVYKAAYGKPLSSLNKFLETPAMGLDSNTGSLTPATPPARNTGGGVPWYVWAGGAAVAGTLIVLMLRP